MEIINMSKLIITSVHPVVEYIEDYIERRISDREWITETMDKRFEGTITLQFQSSGDLSAWTKEEIAQRICEVLLTDHISL